MTGVYGRENHWRRGVQGAESRIEVVSMGNEITEDVYKREKVHENGH